MNYEEPQELNRDSEVDQLYDELKRLEALPADRDEIIRITGITSSHPEFTHLKDLGVNPIALHEGRVARGVLLDAGYVFVNRIGGGEKPLLSAQLPMTVGDEKIIVRLGDRVLLTQAELDTVLAYQKLYPGFMVENADPDAVRKDMLLFLQQAVAEQNGLTKKLNSMFRAAQRRILEDPQYTEENRETLKHFFTKQYEGHQTGFSNLGYLAQESMAGIDLAKVRGVPIEIFSERFSSLQGTPSPFLDSGFHFDTNYDVTLYPNDPHQSRRINMVVVHLLSRGLNEMGGSVNGSYDQIYITALEYEKYIYGRKEVFGEDVSDEILNLIAHRLLRRAGGGDANKKI